MGRAPLIIGTPWFCEVTDEVLGRDADGEVFVVAQVNPLSDMPQEICDSHARLIAAAPDLLAACDAIWKAWLQTDPGAERNDVFGCRTALSKALGEGE